MIQEIVMRHELLSLTFPRTMNRRPVVNVGGRHIVQNSYEGTTRSDLPLLSSYFAEEWVSLITTGKNLLSSCEFVYESYKLE